MQIPSAKYFCKLDTSNVYWQVLLDEESSHLLTFNTPFGRYFFLRMPFGIHSASEICQAYIAEIIENLPGVLNFKTISLYGPHLLLNSVNVLLLVLEEFELVV